MTLPFVTYDLLSYLKKELELTVLGNGESNLVHKVSLSKPPGRFVNPVSVSLLSRLLKRQYNLR